ncbi:Mud1p [Saccharomyces paradoxus]|uniref:Mud1p n=1 Tax=Saccharomyces paradoxus TaxID=27291 RepID=A0A8B8ULS3_SACPA|nr:Mud1 [Saccharomyces paradoxus]QHS71680.1 Mud1 [Saccharomyces paradoxus]
MSALYFQNLPNRPVNKENYTRLLLKYINPNNKYAINSSLPLPRNKLLTAQTDSQPLMLLDDQIGLLEVSISRSSKMSNQAFLTFATQDEANGFLNKYTTTELKFQGRKIRIEKARTNSLLGLSIEMQKKKKNGKDHYLGLKKVLKTRKLKRKLRSDDMYAKKFKLKRQVRRLKHKLRLKKIEEAEINKIVKEFKTHRLENIQSQQEKPKQSQEPLKRAKVSDTMENPPNKVLLVQNLPSGTTEQLLSQIFGNEALVEIRLVSVRNLAFVEYRTVTDATKMKNQLGSIYKLQNSDVTIGFAK